MATNRSGHRPGGGIASRVNVSPSVRTGKGSRGTHPGGVAQLGQRVGDKATHGKSSGSGYRGEPLHQDRSFQPVPFGNSVALNVGKGGPGTGRNLYGQSGVQGCHGQPSQGEDGLPSTKGQWPDRR
jgi:hypothetical protein